MKALIYLFFLITTLSYSQTLKGVITVNPKHGIGDDTELNKKSKTPFVFSYTFQDNKSLQELISKEETTIDTTYITDERIKNQKFASTQVNIRPYRVIFYKNYNQNIYRFESSRKNENFRNEDTSIKDSIPSYNWKIENETQTIAGYNCKKATTTKYVRRLQQITAWYCEDIPINDGPDTFSGLPGLILQIEIDKNTIIKFEKLKFIKEKVTEIKEPKNKTKMLTIDEYMVKMMNGG
jgi:GLPGLI family protein